MKEYWLVFPDERAIEVLTLVGGIYRDLLGKRGRDRKVKATSGVCG